MAEVNKKPPLIILTGPTGVGKTALSVLLAKRTGAEIISADSMQVYRGMDTGTAKIRPEEMCGVPHHLIDVLEPTEPFNVKRFQEMALEAMEGIYTRGRLPMLVGGTGFYIASVLYRTDFTETDDDPYIRLEYEEQVRQGGEDAVRALHEKLALTDPESAAAIPAGNVKRVIRALEYHEKTGKKISEHNRRERAKDSPYDFRYFVLTDDRARLYERVNARVDEMMEEGFADEVRRLKEAGVKADMTSMQALGYRELYAYLEGEYDLERAVELIKRNTRHFVKRQLTWFKRERGVIMLDRSEYGYSNEKICDILVKEKLCGFPLNA